MDNLRILVILLYWDRPNMIRKLALQSIKEMNYDNWELAFIDDGSDIPGRPVVEDVLKESLHKVKFIRAETTMAERGSPGSMIGWHMNNSVRASAADIVVVLCDDDAMHPEYCSNMNKFFTENPDQVWGYSHVIAFDPTLQDYHTTPLTPYFSYNGHTKPIEPACAVDSSQVVYRADCTRKDNIEWPYPKTGCLDMDFYNRMVPKYGLCPFMGFVGQYKAVFADQMGRRPVLTKPQDKVYDPTI